MEEIGMSAARGPSSAGIMRQVTYICGWCGKDNQFTLVDSMVCMSCGHRIFYKKRIAEGMQYDAR